MSPSPLASMFEMGHEQVLCCHEAAAGYRGIIAIHSTALGPATGGTRFWAYASVDDALTDVLRLSRGMTYKNAAAGLAMGGGKAVIIGDNRLVEGREALFRAHGRFVDTLQGRFVTAEDVGTRPADFAVAAMETRHVAGYEGRGEDPSPWTARGVFRGIQAAARYRWGSDDLRGRLMVLQGCGNVGSAVAQLLRGAGARLVVTDVDEARAVRCATAVQGLTVRPDDIYDTEGDVFVPCAMGGVLNDETIARLRVEVVAGAANNQLQDDRHADALTARGILYAPDYVVNAGGVISGSMVLLGETQHGMEQRIAGIFDTLLEVFDLAVRDGLTTAAAADRFAEARLRRVAPSRSLS
jgi:leucine dehydrogenase